MAKPAKKSPKKATAKPAKKSAKSKKRIPAVALDLVSVEKVVEKPEQANPVISPSELNKPLPVCPALPADAEKSKKEKIIVKGYFADERVLLENCDAARELFNTSCYGQLLDDGKLQISLCEALYLIERGKIVVNDGTAKKAKPLDFESFLSKARKFEPNFWVRYCVFKNIRNRGYVIKTALKFGADFRIYDRGVKPGEDHARWIVYPVHEGTTLTWHEFAAKNRVAHSTKKRLMIGIVDDEGDVTYYEIKWIRP
jgi:tRNA-intron endonuclease, archaea type